METENSPGGIEFVDQTVSIEPRLFSHGDGGHFSAFTDIEKKTIFTHNVNF